MDTLVWGGDTDLEWRQVCGVETVVCGGYRGIWCRQECGVDTRVWGADRDMVSCQGNRQ